MANSTVYPYGTGGSLPSSIGIINDLITGGANKALAAQQGVALSDMFETRTYTFAPDSDKTDKAFDSVGAIVTKSGYGIKTIQMVAGQQIEIYGGPLIFSTSYMAVCFSTDNGTIWTPLFSGSDNSARWHWFKAETDGLVGICFASSQSVTVRFDNNETAEANALKETVSPTDICLFATFTRVNITDFVWGVSAEYKCIHISIPNGTGSWVSYRMLNDSYAPIRMIGLRNGIPVRQTKTANEMKATDNNLGSMLIVRTAFQEGIDSVVWILQKQTGHTEEEYASFGIENTYSERIQFANISSVGNFVYENYYPVGSIVKYRSGKIYKIITDKAANAYAPVGGIADTELIKTDNLPIADSMAALVDVMNTVSYNLGAVSSVWRQPYGGSKYAENNNYNRTTAKDMCRIMEYVYRYCPEILSVMSTETAKVHIYGAHDRDKTLKNNTWDKLAAAYTYLHGSGATMPYTMIANKPGATVSTVTAGDGVSNTGFSIVALVKIGDKLLVADAANVSKTNYTDGRLARARAMVELLDICKAILDGGSDSGMSTANLDKGAAAVITPDGLDFIYARNGDDLFQPASTSKVMGAIAMLKVLSNLEEYHSIWNDADELINDSGNDASSPETHIAYAGDVESVYTSLHCMMLVSNGANTMSLARMAGEKIIRSKEQFLDI